ncbi:gamma-glutamylcyclotransferase family protein [Aliikangiella coralliicola]|uniref:Putative gamma-glutamylcyclotransferase n=1 Tax=Aliikangiella coralliicola TaxID=2592383 RepID=A0A545UIU4_9GAMM|nr:gamma-glutamylcyclotransferase family protein [Aliikangiella coralliicola]TQV89382.1 gamma-glutamylcyclotransferase [Aliikangiella coralliicola]
MERLFVYGTLAPGEPNEHILQKLVGTWQSGFVRGKLYPQGWGAVQGYPAMVPDETGDKISGFVFSSTQLSEHWKRLDEFEGEEYERVLVEVELADKRTTLAFVYALKDQ